MVNLPHKKSKLFLIKNYNNNKNNISDINNKSNSNNNNNNDKSSLITALLYRRFTIVSDYYKLHEEIVKLKSVLR